MAAVPTNKEIRAAAMAVYIIAEIRLAGTSKICVNFQTSDAILLKLMRSKD